MNSEVAIQQFRNLSESEERTRYLQFVALMMEHKVVNPKFVIDATFEKVESAISDPELHEFEQVDVFALECLHDGLVRLDAHWLGVLDDDAV